MLSEKMRRRSEERSRILTEQIAAYGELLTIASQIAWPRGERRPCQMCAQVRVIDTGNPDFTRALVPGDGRPPEAGAQIRTLPRSPIHYRPKMAFCWGTTRSSYFDLK